MADLSGLAAEAEQELREILAWWSAKSVDHANGGFLGEIDAWDAPVEAAPKGAVLNARLLWFFSAAAAHLGDPAARALADRARDYVRSHFVDRKRGGVWWQLDAQGRPLDRRKQAYAQAFAIYGFAEHYKLSGDPVSLALANEIFGRLEAHYVDPKYGGYLEARSEAWEPIADLRLSEKDDNAPKTMNTHLHVLEAYTTLHRAAPTATTREALAGAIVLLADLFFDSRTQHLRVFCELDWRPRSSVMSFGHEIEASWLLWEAAEALGDRALSARVKPMSVALARSCLEQGMSPKGSLYNERDGDHLDARSVWWVQAEAVVGFLNAYELSGDPAFLNACERVWSSIKRHHRDRSGEWTWWSPLDAGDIGRAYKGGFWKCPYHNGRAMMEACRRLARAREYVGGAA